jgi:hypothetical protein
VGVVEGATAIVPDPAAAPDVAAPLLVPLPAAAGCPAFFVELEQPAAAIASPRPMSRLAMPTAQTPGMPAKRGTPFGT